MYELLKLKLGQQNRCPFPHINSKGNEYLEKNASCGITEEGAFNCFVCGRGFTDEDWFTSAYLNCSHKQAINFNKALKNNRLFVPQKDKWEENMKRLHEELENSDSRHFKYLNELGLIPIVKEARLGLYKDNITIPSFFKGQIMNICQFRPGETPKYINSPETVSGIITTTKLFDNRKDYILLCAGEKDMMVATSKGFNAITLLGGEKVKPFYHKHIFRDKKVYIAYDNDKAGYEGAVELAKWLYRLTTQIKVLNIGDTFNEEQGDFKVALKEDKEDLTDFFIKYKKTDIELWNLIDNCNWYQPPALENKTLIELVANVNKTMKQIIQNINETETKNNTKRKQAND